MNTLTRTGRFGVIEAPDDRAVIYDLLSGPLSYFVEGAEFSNAYAQGVWDGRKKLVNKVAGSKLSFPVGLFDFVAATLTTAGIDFVSKDTREARPWGAYSAEWTGHTLHAHQVEAVLACTAAPGGVLNEPVRSGKTLMAARVIFELGQRALFVAPSDFLVAQARDVLRACISGPDITVVGLGGDDASGDIVVASIATLDARQKTRWWEKFRTSFGVVFVDELHHTLGIGESWRDTALGIDAARRYGLTGTLDSNEPQIRLWAHGLCGPTLHRTSMRTLTERGFLTPLTVRFVRHDAPSLPDREWTRSTYADGIVKCEPRSVRLCQEAVRYSKEGKSVLVDVAQIGHGRRLVQILRGMLRPGEVQMLDGSTPHEDRLSVIANLRAGVVKVVVSTFLGEGIDIPELAVVVNAEGGKASPSTIQRLRNLTPFPGKTEAILVEAIDDHAPSLASWTKERLTLYRSEGFKIEVEPATANTPDRSRPKVGRILPRPVPT